MMQAKIYEALAGKLLTGLVHVHAVYDTINQYCRAWRAELGRSNSLERGTAATLIIEEGAQPGAFDAQVYAQRRCDPDRAKITLETLTDDLDASHLEGVRVVAIMRFLLEFILNLRHLAAYVEDFVTVRRGKHRTLGYAKHSTSPRRSGLKFDFNSGSHNVGNPRIFIWATFASKHTSPLEGTQ